MHKKFVRSVQIGVLIRPGKYKIKFNIRFVWKGRGFKECNEIYLHKTHKIMQIKTAITRGKSDWSMPKGVLLTCGEDEAIGMARRWFWRAEVPWRGPKWLYNQSIELTQQSTGHVSSLLFWTSSSVSADAVKKKHQQSNGTSHRNRVQLRWHVAATSLIHFGTFILEKRKCIGHHVCPPPVAKRLDYKQVH